MSSVARRAERGERDGDGCDGDDQRQDVYGAVLREEVVVVGVEKRTRRLPSEYVVRVWPSVVVVSV